MASAFCRVVAVMALAAGSAGAQVPPSPAEIAAYRGLHGAAARGTAAEIVRLRRSGASVDERDGYGRTPLHVAAYAAKHEAMRALVEAGADRNARENDRYDIVTIAAVANDVPTLKLALELGASARNVTSRYDGTALIAAPITPNSSGVSRRARISRTTSCRTVLAPFPQAVHANPENISPASPALLFIPDQ